MTSQKSQVLAEKLEAIDSSRELQDNTELGDSIKRPSVEEISTVSNDLSSLPGQSAQLPSDFSIALTYIEKVKTYYKDRPKIYQQFLSDLEKYQLEQNRGIQDIYERIAVLFEDAPDLIEGFKRFLPPNQNVPTATQAADAGSNS